LAILVLPPRGISAGTPFRLAELDVRVSSAGVMLDAAG
jgi:hypothetical protein